MQIKFTRSAARKRTTRDDVPQRPDGEPADTERTYEDHQDAAFDPLGDRAPDEDDETVVRREPLR